jgi:hypothetical protein
MTAPLLTEPQAAAHLAVCPRTLRKARKSGQLHYVLIGRAIRYTLADLAQFIDSHRQEDAPCRLTSPKPKAHPHGANNVIVPFTRRG